MSGKAPITIMTDQEVAMATTIKIMQPFTNHRSCIWHICQDAPRNLGGIYNKIVDGSKVFSHVFKI